MQNAEIQNEAETQREFFEELRRGGEGMRQESEAERNAAEEERQESQRECEGEESFRSLAESSRNAAEAVRQGSEESRTVAEAARHASFTLLARELRESLAELREWSGPSKIHGITSQGNQNPMQPIVNFSAQTVCWLNGQQVFSNLGLPVAFINQNAVFAVNTHGYLGQFENGVFRDRLGCIVASIQKKWWLKANPAQNASVPPHCKNSPALGQEPQPVAPLSLAEPLLSRSTLDWEHFVTGCEPKSPWTTRR